MNAIVCVDENWGIGKDGHLLFNIPEDMKLFKDVTEGCIVVMGAKTFDSLPNGALKNRINIVLDSKMTPRLNCTVVENIPSLLRLLNNMPDGKVFVIGGGQVYRQLLPYCKAAFVTRVKALCDADVTFPDLTQDDNFELFINGWENTSITGLKYHIDVFINKHIK